MMLWFWDGMGAGDVTFPIRLRPGLPGIDRFPSLQPEETFPRTVCSPHPRRARWDRPRPLRWLQWNPKIPIGCFPRCGPILGTPYPTLWLRSKKEVGFVRNARYGCTTPPRKGPRRQYSKAPYRLSSYDCPKEGNAIWQNNRDIHKEQRGGKTHRVGIERLGIRKLNLLWRVIQDFGNVYRVHFLIHLQAFGAVGGLSGPWPKAFSA